MALPPPPNPLTPAELECRYRPGMSMGDLDPELVKWAERNARFYRWAIAGVSGMAAACLAAWLIIAVLR